MNDKDKEERAKLQPKRNEGEGNEAYNKRCQAAGFRYPKVKGQCTNDHSRVWAIPKEWECRCGHICFKDKDGNTKGFCMPDEDGGIE